MNVVSEFPRSVRLIDNLWIELSDGCRLAARLWLPADADADPVPAILEYLPYRKRDGTVARDEPMHGYLAGHGYACVRVDIRGNGESDGLMEDEYSAQELADGEEVIAWIAAQPWCSGRVGMMGISWGGFNALQIAARRPAALKAIVTVCSTDDRYADDVHFMGGCLLNDNLTWSSQMLAISSRPPDPAIVGDGWRDIWLRRLEAMPLLAANWLRHQRRDAFWRHGSVCEDFAAIEAAVLVVGGWADAYTNAVPRLLSGLSAPAKGLIGPWVHMYPHIAYPGPAIGFLQEMRRWWDHWLKGEDTGVLEVPDLRAYIVDSVAPATHYATMPGRWVAEARWPPPEILTRTLHLGPRSLSEAPGNPVALTLDSPLSTGLNCGSFCPGMRVGPEFPGDQRPDDALSLCFDSAPLGERWEVLGAAVLEVTVISDKPVAQLVARLCDVHPDGASTRVAYMPFNLTHRDGHAEPAPLESGRPYRIRLQLGDAGYAFRPGNRVRLALSSAYWPMVWPAPERARLTILSEGATLTLPLRGAGAGTDELVLPPPEAASPAALEVLRPASGARTVTRDEDGELVSVQTDDNFGVQRLRPHGLEVGSRVRQRFTIGPEDPSSAQTEASWSVTVGRGDWRTRSETWTRMWSDSSIFHLEAKLEAYEGETLVCARRWRESVPRDLV
jgi:putative CocE/NonD family hydrolase